MKRSDFLDLCAAIADSQGCSYLDGRDAVSHAYSMGKNAATVETSDDPDNAVQAAVNMFYEAALMDIGSGVVAEGDLRGPPVEGEILKAQDLREGALRFAEGVCARAGGSSSVIAAILFVWAKAQGFENIPDIPVEAAQ